MRDFLSLFYRLAHLALQNVNKDYVIFLYFSRFVNAKNLTDLLKSYGPNEESLLMTFCCQKNDSAVLRAQIFAFLSRVLLESNQGNLLKEFSTKPLEHRDLEGCTLFSPLFSSQ